MRASRDFQTTRDTWPDRADHVWLKVREGRYKCVICGGVTSAPPYYPTPEAWVPEVFEPLTNAERILGLGGL